MQSEQHKDLWRRIQQFEIDDPLAGVKYSDKLGYHHAWSKEYTARVIEEYKKFIFLSCVLPGGASPSKAVDEAWHLHLTYTHNYWKEFCNAVLGKEIHHYPSKGGPDEKEKHQHWYDSTLTAYQRFFNEMPPADIWPSENIVKQTTALPAVDLNNYRQWYKRYLYILFLPFLGSAVFYGKINPYNLTGPRFLIFYGCLVAATAIYLLLIRRKKRMEIGALIIEQYKTDADIYQVARFVYGKEKSLRAAIVDLVARNILLPARKSQFVFKSSQYTYSKSEKNPLAKALIRNVKNDEKIPFQSLSGYYDEDATYHTGLSSLYKSVAVKDYRPLIIILIVMAIGLIRIIQGNHHNKPVSYLVIMGLISIFILVPITWLSAPRRIFQNYFENNFKAFQPAEYTDAGWASSFVFSGLASLTVMNGYSQLHSTFSREEGKKDSGSWGSSCGSSGCGSDGGGSGCGGGGCGGCGGGD